MEENELQVPLFDFATGEFVTNLGGEVQIVTEGDAVKMVIEKIMNTARGVYLIYADSETTENNHIYGNEISDVMTRGELSEQVRMSEIRRAITEALIYDAWILDVSEIEIKRLSKNEISASFSVTTIFDKKVEVERVISDG